MQMGARKAGEANLTIGFAVYELDASCEGLMKRGFFTMNRPYAMSEFTNSREVVKRLRVKPGSYMIFPSTFKPNQERKFLLRVFTEVPVKEAEIDDKNALKGLSPNEDTVVDKLFESKADKRTKSIGAEQLMEIFNKSSLKINSSVLIIFYTFSGFNLSSSVFSVVVQRFVTRSISAVTFEDWILCCVRLKNAFENSKAQSKTNDGHLIFTEDDVSSLREGYTNTIGANLSYFLDISLILLSSLTCLLCPPFK
ncbi:unnamed protein product [Schistocephalus solidus]|uniref:Calpain_III domain-containing protein n=1 Tax=Schistocephalus solidus TaxID=70667 RepID=A0A183TFQ0_SCHSO|nr:unnamed protein product [Schistocephalus solidus]